MNGKSFLGIRIEKGESNSARAERYKGILESARRVLLNEAEKLRYEEREFYERLLDNSQNHPMLVQEVMSELVRYHGIKKEWEQWGFYVEEENRKLANKTQWDAVTIQNYHRKLTENRKLGSDRIRELDIENQELRRNLATFHDAGHRHMMAISALEGKHKKEIKDLRDQNQEKIDGLNQIHAMEKMKLQTETEKNVRKKLNYEIENLKQQYKIDTKEAQTVHNRELGKVQDKLAKIENKHKGEKERIKEELKKEITELETRIGEMERTQQAELQRKQREHTEMARIASQTHASDIRKAQQELQTAKNQWEQAKSQIQREHNSELDRLRKDHKNDTEALNKKHLSACADLNTQMEQMKSDHSKHIHDTNTEYQNQIRNLNDRIDKMVRDHEKEIDGLKATHLNECENLNDQIATLKKNHAQEIETLNQQHREEKETFAQETADNLTRVTDDHQKKITSLKKKHANEIDQLEKKHAAETQQIKKDRNAYSAALLARDKARDKFDELSDVEIKAKFQGVKQEVEKLAALEWRSDQTPKINRLSPTPTVLMRQILQDTIWVILYEYIFGSPFRIFGNEGMILEKKWFKECEPGTAISEGRYIWPRPEVATERWRYTTIKEGRDALRKPVSEYDNRAKLKKGFLAASEELRTQLESTLNEVIDLNKSNIQTIKDLTRKASTVWLEMGMQRFRIVVVIQDSGLDSISQRITRAQEGSLELVLIPELKSFGDSKGGDLDEEQTIRGCEGEIFLYKGPQRRG